MGWTVGVRFLSEAIWPPALELLQNFASVTLYYPNNLENAYIPSTFLSLITTHLLKWNNKSLVIMAYFN